MRRSEKEIKNPAEIDAILQAAPVCRIAMVSGGRPYVLPVNFAASGRHLYFHCAKSGRKIDILRANPAVCFEVDIPGDLVRGEKACSWGMRYQSVIGFGEAYFIEDADGKKRALDILMKKYAGHDSFDYPAEALDKVCVIGVKIEEQSGKQSGEAEICGTSDGARKGLKSESKDRMICGREACHEKNKHHTAGGSFIVHAVLWAKRCRFPAGDRLGDRVYGHGCIGLYDGQNPEDGQRRCFLDNADPARRM